MSKSRNPGSKKALPIRCDIMLNETELVSLVAHAKPTSSIVILPEDRDGEGVAVYDEKSIFVSKRLRADGLAVEWAADAEHRTFRSERSAAATIVGLILGIPFGIMSNAAWDGIKRLFATAPHDVDQATVDVIRLTNADGSTYERMKFEGTGAEIAKAIEQLLPPPAPPDPESV